MCAGDSYAASSCLARASTMLVPRPALAGAGPLGMPTPSSLTDRVQSAPCRSVADEDVAAATARGRRA